MRNFKEFLTTTNEVYDKHVDQIAASLHLDPDELPHDDLYDGQYRVAFPFEDSKIAQLKRLISKKYNTTSFPGLIDYKIDWGTGQIEINFKNPKAGRTVIDKKTRQPSQVPDRTTKNIKISKFLKNTDDKEMIDWWSSFMDTSAMSAEKRKAFVEKTDKYSVVVSRHPIDVMRMSDHDGLSSCHSPGDSYFKCAQQEAVDGGGVAYLVDTEDLEDIDINEDEIFEDYQRSTGSIEPRARIRIRRYTSTFPDEKTGDEFDFAVPETTMYGLRMPEFKEKVAKWTRDKQEDLISRNGGRENFRIDNFVLRGGSYRDSSDGALFNNFFNDSFDHGNTTHRFQGQDSLVGIGDQYERELEEMREEWNRELDHCHVDYLINDWEGDQFTYDMSGYLMIAIPQSSIYEEPEEHDIHGESRYGSNWQEKWLKNQVRKYGLLPKDEPSIGELRAKEILQANNLSVNAPHKPVSLVDRLEEIGYETPSMSTEQANVESFREYLKITIYFDQPEDHVDHYSNDHYNDDGLHPDAFDEFCSELSRNYDQEYDKIVEATNDWLITRRFGKIPPARELEEKIYEEEIHLNHFEMYERDHDELGTVIISATGKINLKTSHALGQTSGWNISQQVDLPGIKKDVFNVFLRTLQSDAIHYDRQQWLPFADTIKFGKEPNPYAASKLGMPKITIDSDRATNITIDVEFELKDSHSKAAVDATEKNLQIFDKRWDGLIRSAQAIVQRTLMGQEQQARQAQPQQTDQQKLSSLLGAKQRPGTWRKDPKLIPDPQTPEEISAADKRDFILKRGKYAPKTPEASS